MSTVLKPGAGGRSLTTSGECRRKRRRNWTDSKAVHWASGIPHLGKGAEVSRGACRGRSSACTAGLIGSGGTWSRRWGRDFRQSRAGMRGQGGRIEHLRGVSSLVPV